MLLQTQSSAKRAEFPKGFDIEEARLKKQEYEVKLRTDLRQNILQRKRTSTETFLRPCHLPSELQPFANTSANSSLHPEQRLENLIEHLLTDSHKEFSALVTLRKVLSCEKAVHFSASCMALMPKLSKKLVSLMRSSNKKVQLEAAWCVTNLACTSAEINRKLVHDGVISGLAALISSSPEVADMAVSGLGNIVGDCVIIRNQIVESGVVEVIIRSIADSALMDLVHLSNRIHFLSVMVSLQPLPPPCIVWSVLDLFNKLFATKHDSVRLEVITILADIAKVDEYRERASECIGYAVECLNSKNPDIQARALIALCIISDKRPEKVMEHADLLLKIDRILERTVPITLKSALKALCNLLACSKSAIKILSSHRIKLILGCLKHSDSTVVSEALCCLFNICCLDSSEPLMAAIAEGLLNLLSSLLTNKDPNLLRDTLAALDNVFDRLSETCEYEEALDLFESCSGLHNLQLLQLHPNLFIYDMSLKILTQHFEVEEMPLEAFVFS
mmetsp:Transcript_18181/g.32583  ORF Transcript_18181/g.32583 Transcript_18181/m.32583 type:complete len:504 (+) Transcript_18181:1311-2822(+)